MNKNALIIPAIIALSLCGCALDRSKVGTNAQFIRGLTVKIPETDTLVKLTDTVRIGDELYLKRDYSVGFERSTVMLNRLLATEISGIGIGSRTDTIYWAAPFSVSPQGSGVFHYVGLFAYDPAIRQNTHLDSFLLGDRIEPLKIKDTVRAVRVYFAKHAPGQPFTHQPTEPALVNLYVQDNLTWRPFQGMHPSWDQNNDGINDCEEDGTCDDSVDYTKGRTAAAQPLSGVLW